MCFEAGPSAVLCKMLPSSNYMQWWKDSTQQKDYSKFSAREPKHWNLWLTAVSVVSMTHSNILWAFPFTSCVVQIVLQPIPVWGISSLGRAHFVCPPTVRAACQTRTQMPPLQHPDSQSVLLLSSHSLLPMQQIQRPRKMFWFLKCRWITVLSIMIV